MSVRTESELQAQLDDARAAGRELEPYYKL